MLIFQQITNFYLSKLTHFQLFSIFKKNLIIISQTLNKSSLLATYILSKI